MINLLPPEEKHKLMSKKKERLTTILGIVFLIFLICLTLVLLSIKFYILTATDYQKDTLRENEQKSQAADFMNFKNIIQKYNSTLVQLDSFYKKEIYFSQALKTITAVPKPAGLDLLNFSLSRDISGKIKVSVSGFSDTRNDLLVFKTNIEENQKIKNFYFSPDSWINPENANFSLTFEIDQNEKQ